MGRINVFRTKEIKEAIAASPDKAQEIIDNEKEYEIVRFWEVVKKDGERIKIQAAAAFFDNIMGANGKGRKVTFAYYED